jgi:hypothetical protein
MRETPSLLKLTSVVLVTILILTFAAPAKAEAIDPVLAISLASLAVVAIIIIVYLVVASTRGPKMQSESEEAPSRMACLQVDGVTQRCWTVAGAEMSPALPERAIPQS